MAVDTAAKRFSIMRIGSPTRGLPAVPDGSIDRLVPLFLYTGIAAAAPAVSAPSVYTITPALVTVYTITPALATIYTITHAVTPGGQTMATYPHGSTLRIAVKVQAAGVDVDPTALTVKARKPNGLITSYTYAGATVTKDSVGDYHVDVLLDKGGTWVLGSVGTGSNPGAAEEVEIDVAETAF
jgi:hypothetical protein